MKKFSCLVSVFVAVAAASVAAAPRTASVTETNLVFKTYPFSDPDPVPATEKTRYPYFFFDGTAWVDYEHLQSEVFEYILATLPEFGLKVFQSPTGNDIKFFTGDENSI